MKVSDIFATTDRKENGAWIENLIDLPEVAVKVRGVGNAEYRRRLAAELGSMTQEQRGDEKEVEKLEVRLLSEVILLDWRGLEDLPYSPEAAFELLSDPRAKAFRDAIETAAKQVARAGRETLEADAKN